jgi:nitroreductase
MRSTEMLLKRRSCPRLGAPGPTLEQLEIMIRSALRAADHGRLRPSRFIVFQDEGLERLADAYEAAAMEGLEGPVEAEAAIRQKARAKARRAPMVVAVVSAVEEHPKVPAEEQIQSTAAACQNLLNAAFALNVGAYWRTGSIVRSERARQVIGLAAHETLVGLVYLGSPQVVLEPADTSDWQEKVSWVRT